MDDDLKIAGPKVIGELHRRHRSHEFYLVMDNYSTHKTPTVKRWLARNPPCYVHFTPTSASWLNHPLF